MLNINYSWDDSVHPLSVINPTTSANQVSSIFLSGVTGKGRYLMLVYPKTVEVMTLDSKTCCVLCTSIHILPS